MVVSRTPLHVSSLGFLLSPTFPHLSPTSHAQPSSAPMGLRSLARMEQPPGPFRGKYQAPCRPIAGSHPDPLLFRSRREAGAINRGCIPLLPMGSTAGQPDDQHPPMPLDRAAARFLAKFPLLGCKMKGQTARDGPPAFHQDVPVLPGRLELV